MRRKWRASVVRERATVGPNEYGSEGTRDWSAPDVLPIHRCLLLPASTGEGTEDDPVREAAEERWVLRISNPLADVDKGDRITYREHTYDVTGFPAQWATGSRLDHLLVVLARVEG